MKTRSLFPLSAALLLSACASDPQTTGKTKPRTADEVREAEENKPPFVGMTKEQAFARYGEPRQKNVTDEGEIWVYVLNLGEVMGKALIPFNFKPTTIRTGTLTFGPKGRVTKFNWTPPTNG